MKSVVVVLPLLAALVTLSAAQCTPIPANLPATPTYVYDLSPLASDVDYDVPNTRYPTYSFKINVCRAITSGRCPANTGVCEYAVSGSSETNLGQFTTTATLQGSQLMMTYPEGTGCYTTKITFICSPGSGKGAPVYKSEGCEYTFDWVTEYACARDPSAGGEEPGPSTGGLSGGDVFLILFFVGGFLYVAIGMVYNRQRHDKRGVEMIPNVEFWKELPGLCKDGCRFTYEKIFKR